MLSRWLIPNDLFKEITVATLALILWGVYFPWEDYRLFAQYRSVQNQLDRLTPKDFTIIAQTHSSMPRILCRLLEKGFQSEPEIQNLADQLGQEMIKNSYAYTATEHLDLLTTVDQARALDPRYERWIVEEGLFYLPGNVYFLSRKYLLNYEISSSIELTPYERMKALAFLENMLRSEERSS